MPQERSYLKSSAVIQDSRKPTSELVTSRSSSTVSSKSGSSTSSSTSSSTYNMGGSENNNQAPRDIVRSGGYRESVYRVPGDKKDIVTKISRHSVDVINQNMRRADQDEPRSKDASSADYIKSCSKRRKQK